MRKSALSSQPLFVCYLQELYDTKAQQTAYYAYQVEHDYSIRFSHFLTKQQKDTYKHFTSLQDLADLLSVRLSGENRSPVRNLFRDARQINRFAYRSDDSYAVESTIAQLLQGVKRHETVIGRWALILACNRQETTVASVLSNILEEDERAYWQLQHLAANHQQNFQSAQ